MTGRRVKILYHHRTASRDGQAVHIEEMVGALRSLGHDVRVVGPASETGQEMGSAIGWVQRLNAALPGALYELLEFAYSLVALIRIARAVREFEPDVIYERYNLFLVAGLTAKRWFRLPLLLEVNSPLVDERMRDGGLSLVRLARWIERAVWQGAERVLPVTRVLAERIIATGVPECRVKVVSNGVNERHFAGALAPAAAKARLRLSGHLVFGFTGFVRDWHGVDRIIRWMSDSAAPRARLLVVGDGPARASLELLARERKLGDRVTFTGVVPREQVPDYVSAFDIALQPAVVPYASPLKLFEYLALGKAIVAPRQPNIEEILVDGANALLFDPSDPEGLETALDRIAGDDELRMVLAAGAAKTIREKELTWLDCAKRVSDLCERVVAGEAGKAGYQCRTAD